MPDNNSDKKLIVKESFSESENDLLTLSQAAERAPKSTTSRLFWTRIFLILILVALAFGGFLYFWKGPHHFPISNSLPDHVSFRPLISFEFNESVFFKEWKEHVFHGRTIYRVELGENGEKTLHALSQGTSSLIYKEANIKLSDRPFLTWEWKTVQFPSNKENKILASKHDNDFAARMYIAFKGRTPFVSDVIEYVWDDHFPEGSFAESPYLKSTKILVVHSGKSDQWIPERRDLIRDYEMLFGHHPKGNVIAVGIMSDSDNTGSASEAYFKNISIQGPEIKGKVSASNKWQLPIVGGAVSRVWRILSGQK